MEAQANSPLVYEDASTLAKLIRTRQVSPVEVVNAHLDRIEALNPAINAIVTLADSARQAARVAEAAVLSGQEPEPAWPGKSGAILAHS